MVKILVVQMRYQHLRLENQVEHPPTSVSHFHSSDLEGRRKKFPHGGSTTKTICFFLKIGTKKKSSSLQQPS
jgi:hypothetical protein